MSIQQEAGLKQYITARYNIRQPLIISVCTEMELLNGIFSQGFWALTQVFLDSSVLPSFFRATKCYS
jgi:hypothetical protein